MKCDVCEWKGSENPTRWMVQGFVHVSTREQTPTRAHVKISFNMCSCKGLEKNESHDMNLQRIYKQHGNDFLQWRFSCKGLQRTESHKNGFWHNPQIETMIKTETWSSQRVLGMEREIVHFETKKPKSPIMRRQWREWSTHLRALVRPSDGFDITTTTGSAINFFLLHHQHDFPIFLLLLKSKVNCHGLISCARCPFLWCDNFFWGIEVVTQTEFNTISNLQGQLGATLWLDDIVICATKYEQHPTTTEAAHATVWVCLCLWIPVQGQQGDSGFDPVLVLSNAKRQLWPVPCNTTITACGALAAK